MATPLDQTPAWFNAQHYLDSKLAQLLLEEPGKWDMASLKKAFGDTGFENPYDHYLAYGDAEGNDPSALFNADEYLAAKAVQMGTGWTAEMVAEAIHKAGMTYAEHYAAYGSKEGVNPSTSFSQAKYLEAKLDKLQTSDPAGNWTQEKLLASFEAAGLTPLDHYFLYAKEEGLTDPMYDYAVNGEPIPHPGKNISLTAGADVATPTATVAALATSARDDVISGTVSGTPSKNTLNDTDVIDGGNGIDTLKVDMQGNFGGFKADAGVTNVEKIELLNASGRTFNASGIEKAQTYIVHGGDKATTITNVDSADTAYTLTQNKLTFTATLTDDAAAGKDTNVTVTLNGVGTDAKTRVTLDVDNTAEGGVENLTLVAKGASSFVTLGDNHTGVSVSGAGDLDLSLNAAASLITFDGANATGDLTLDLTDATDVKAVKMGAGDDTVTFNKKTGFSLDGGDGNDTLILGVTKGDSFKGTITGFETIQVAVTSALTSGVTIAMNSVSEDMGTFFVTGAKDASGAGVFTLKGAVLESLNYVVDSALISTGGLVYDGVGVLNVSLEGAGHTIDASDDTTTITTIKSITASKASDMVITNSDAKIELVVEDIVADALVNLTIDAVSKDVTVGTSAAAASDFAALENIFFKGTGDVAFYGAQASGVLASVNATELKGELTLDLSGFTYDSEGGVTVDMGTGGGTLEGTAGTDIFNLGSGAEKVGLRAQVTGTAGVATQNGGDVINDFDFVYDTLSIFATTTASAGVTFAASAWFEVPASSTAAVKADSMFSIATVVGDLKDTAAGGTIEDLLVTAWSKAAVSDSANTYALLTDGENVGIYQITFTASVAASASATAGHFFVELLGVVSGADIQNFDATLFA